MKNKIVLGSVFLFGTLLLATGCGQVAFQAGDSGGTLKDVTLGTSSTGTTGSDSTGNLIQPGQPGSGTNTGTNTDTNTGTADADTTIVECDLGGPSEKATSGGAAAIEAQHSNASSTRICMTENACLNLVNAYAAARGCLISTGAASTPGATAQCTQIFPGSKGTCNNATLLSDADIAAILVKMGGS